MKKIIQIGSILTLAIVFSIVSVNAQTSAVFKANIPNGFNLGTKSYPAGSYSLKVARHTFGGSVVTLTDSTGDNLQTVLATLNGSTVEGNAILNFSIIDGERYLDGIVTRDGGFQVGRVVKKRQPGVRISSTVDSTESITIALN
jgi:hypothetical protein